MRRTCRRSRTTPSLLLAAWAEPPDSSTNTSMKAPCSPSRSSPAVPVSTPSVPGKLSVPSTCMASSPGPITAGLGKKAAPLTSWRKPSMSRGTSKHVERATPTNGTAGRGGRRRCNGCRGAGSDVVDAAPPRPRSCSASAIGRTIRDTPAARVEAITEPRSPS
ncbi:hypothetical protein ACFPRL_35615 [Pseudoclavibacter helvolus]